MNPNRSRSMTDLYVAAVAEAVATPGAWVRVGRVFETEKNAAVTGHCLRQGFLRVKPRDNDPEIVVRGKRLLRTPAPVETDIVPVAGGWTLTIRTAGSDGARS